MLPPRRGDLPPRDPNIFVNREGPIAVFEEAAANIPPDSARILVFYGVGGQGKSALCRKLMRLTDKEETPEYAYLRRAHVDLHGRPKTDPDRLLVWIRNGFARAGVALPAFDLAFAITWEATRGDEPFPKLENAWLARTKEALGDVGGESVHATREVLEETAETIPGLGALIRRVGGWVIDTSRRAYLERTREHLQLLYRDGTLKGSYELSELLPWMLAQDLNCHIKEHPVERFVLLIDEYERVFDEGGASSRWNENTFDKHLRTITRETDGLLLAVFSRERLPWDRDPVWKPALEGRQHLLGGLDRADAEAWLRDVLVEDGALRTAMIEASREGEGKDANVYPLLLDLQVAHWRNLVAANVPIEPGHFSLEGESFLGRLQELVERVLRDYGEGLQKTLEHLSVVNRFDRAAFAHVVETFKIAISVGKFEDITSLSFVTKGDHGFLEVHRAIAEAISSALPAEIHKNSIRVLFEHFDLRANLSKPIDIKEGTLIALVEAAQLRVQIGIDGFCSWLKERSKTITSSGHYAFGENVWRNALGVIETHDGSSLADLEEAFSHIGSFVNYQGRHSEAEILFRKSLEIAERSFGFDHVETSGCRQNLACCLDDLGRHEEAEILHRESLIIMKKLLGDNHPRTAASYDNFGLCVASMGRFREAEALHRNALRIREKSFGPEDRDTINSQNNMAGALTNLGRFEEAELILRNALNVSERTLGTHHPDTSTSYNNLAYCLQSQGEYGEAEVLYRKALPLLEDTLGIEHPHSVSLRVNLVTCLLLQGRLWEAETLSRSALEIYERVLGLDHPLTANGFNNVASCLDTQGRHGEAELLFRKALKIRERVFGGTHPDTATGLNNVAMCVNAQGRHGEAEPILRKALEVREGVLGEDHPDTAASFNNVAFCLDAQGRHGEAEPLHRKTLEIHVRVLGPDNPSTATSLNNLGSCVNYQGRNTEAEPLLRKALEIRARVLGADHPDTGSSFNNVASCLNAQGRHGEAEPLYRKALEISERILGIEHPNTKACARNLEVCLHKMRRS